MVIGEVMTFLIAVLTLGSADTPGLVEEKGSFKNPLLPFTYANIPRVGLFCFNAIAFLY